MELSYETAMAANSNGSQVVDDATACRLRHLNSPLLTICCSACSAVTHSHSVTLNHHTQSSCQHSHLPCAITNAARTPLLRLDRLGPSPPNSSHHVTDREPHTHAHLRLRSEGSSVSKPSAEAVRGGGRQAHEETLVSLIVTAATFGHQRRVIGVNKRVTEGARVARAATQVDKCQAFFKRFAHGGVPSVFVLQTNILAPKKHQHSRVLLHRCVRHAAKIREIVGVVAAQDDLVGFLVEHEAAAAGAEAVDPNTADLGRLVHHVFGAGISLDFDGAESGRGDEGGGGGGDIVVCHMTQS
jgi:hypothetical protein